MRDPERLEVGLAHLDGFVRVKLRGDLDYASTVEKSEALREVADLRQHVVLDLGEVDFVDSAGLRFLATLAKGHDGPVRLEHVPPNVAAVLRIAGLAEILDLEAS
jgi:anti-anti-sigma factor